MSIACPLCGSAQMTELGGRSSFCDLEEYARYVEDLERFDRAVYACSVCGLQFIWPMYDADDIRELYDGPGYDVFLEKTSPYDDPHGSEALALHEYYTRRFRDLGLERWARRFQEDHGRRPRFLDVGCGIGRALRAFRELGFDVMGIDASARAVEHVRGRLSLPVEHSSWEDFEPPHAFDCVMAFHLIEHVSDPHAAMGKLGHCLENGGLLLIETPVAEDFGGAEERYRDIYHTLFLDHFTMIHLAAMHGFRPVETINRYFRFENEALTHVFFCGVFERSEQGALLSADADTVRVYRSVYESVRRDFLDLIRLRLEDRPAPARKRDPEVEAEDSSEEHEESSAGNERHGEPEAEERAEENDADATSFMGRLRGLLNRFAANASRERSALDERPPKPSEP